MSNELTIEDKIAQRIAPAETRRMAVGETQLQIRDMGQLLEFAKVMAIGGVAVPKYLRGNPGACVAICLQSIEWQMSPYAVANKSYSVNDRIAYEAQLVNAVILRRAPIEGRPTYTYRGEGQSRQCRVEVTLRDSGQLLDYESPPIGKITVQNSPLWKGDPDQQLAYYAVRAMARRHFPDIILGVIEREEAREMAIEPDPQPKSHLRRTYEQRLDALANGGQEDTQAAQEPQEQASEEITVEATPEEQTAADKPPEALLRVASKGSRALRLALGKLSQAELDAIPANQLAVLSRTAKMIDRNNGDTE